MHIPGHGFLSLPVSALAGVASAGCAAQAIRGLRAGMSENIALKMAAIAALIFAGQMFNYPIANGTSGHLIGAALAAALLGPYAATIVMIAVLVVQCALFGDGGWFTLGANVFNMGVVAVWAGWIFYRGFGADSTFSRYMALFVGSWASVVAAASACSLELAVSGTAPLSSVLPAMISAHATVGIGEGVLAIATYALVSKLVPTYTSAFAVERKA
jgi:cobalt/nickel transport system permease protein